MVPILAAALIFSGCGGGGSSSPSKAEFVKQANAICARAGKIRNTGLAAARSKLAEGKAAEEEVATTVALPPILTMAEELQDLGVPDGDEDQVNAFVEIYKARVEDAEVHPFRAVKGAPDPFTKADMLAAQYGLTACAQI